MNDGTEVQRVAPYPEIVARPAQQEGRVWRQKDKVTPVLGGQWPSGKGHGRCHEQ